MALESTIPSECPPDADFVELLERRLPEDAAARLEEHLAGCADCRALVDELTKGDTELSIALTTALGAAVGQRSSIGRYRVLSLIGRGGMGEIHAAYDPELDRRVALKLLHTATRSPAAKRRLLREARALGKLSHPNVVQVYDVGEHEGNVFMAMELVEGQTFDAWCRAVPPPSWQAVLAAYLDAARGLSAAHDKGLVHRDVKPSNILHGADGRVRVVDFGLAAVDDEGAPSEPAARAPEIDAEIVRGAPAGSLAPFDAMAVASTWPAPSGTRTRRADRLTATGAILGTPIYMAPEQYEGSRGSAASDQYSLCTAIFEGLYGALPFGTGPDASAPIEEIVAAKKEGAHAAPPPGSPVPAWVHKVIARGLAPRPEDRYPSLLALIAALGEDPDAEPARSRRRAESASRVPRPITPLVGRVDELREITARVRATRLLTLSGAGGVGKSRLAMQIASDVAAELGGGVWFVELAPLADPDLVMPTVASVLGVHEVPGRSLFEALVASLSGRRGFLVLDNCEHVLDAASRLAEDLLHACADLRILATSRQSLGLTGEVAWRVPSLVAADAVALFHERAGQQDDAATVAQICQRLDGIPLAIELAAARTRVLSVAQIAARLDDRFRLLTDGSRSALPRHRTLKAAVDWGYQLLSDEEQRLLRRLSVFTGGSTLEAIEAVAGPGPHPGYAPGPGPHPGLRPGPDVLDPLANLVDKSLVVFSDRYRMLETVREYAAARLDEHGETHDARTRHLDHFIALAETAEPHIFGGDGGAAWTLRLEEDNDNFRAAFDFCEADERRAEAALRLASALHWFWFARAHLREGHRRMLNVLRRRDRAPARARARALAAAGFVSMWVGDYDAMAGLATESLAIARDLADDEICSYALSGHGTAAVYRGDTAAARPILAEAAALARAKGNLRLLVFALYWLGTAEHGEGDLEAARTSLGEGHAIAERDDNPPGVGHTLFGLGEVAESAGDPHEARRCYVESLRTLSRWTDRWGIARVLDALARLAVNAEQPERGARIFGFVEALCELTGARVPPSQRSPRAIAAARLALGDPAFAAAWTEGRALEIEHAVTYALQG